jgi:hypothetical protein
MTLDKGREQLIRRGEGGTLSSKKDTHRPHHPIPSTARRLEENGFTSIKELLRSLQVDPSDDSCPSITALHKLNRTNKNFSRVT